MNKRPGHVKVTTEAGYCNFCGRPRNLRSEEHQLGNFVRTVVTCETCHRTLSSTMGVASTEPAAAVEAPASEEKASPASGSKSSGAPSGAKPHEVFDLAGAPGSGHLPGKRGGAKSKVKTTKTRAAKSK